MEKILGVAKAILEMTENKTTFSVDSLAKKVGMSNEDVGSILDRLEETGGISGFGALKLRYAATRPALEELVRRLEPQPTDAAIDGGDQTPAPAPEPEGSQPTSSTPPPAPKVKLTRLDRIMAKIAAVPMSKLTDAERSELVDKAFAKMTDLVVEANKAITALAEKTDLVSADIDLFDIIRVMPENGKGTGGARVTYSAGTGCRGAKVLIDVPWDVNPTRKGLEKAVRKVEDKTLNVLGRMADYVIKNSSK